MTRTWTDISDLSREDVLYSHEIVEWLEDLESDLEALQEDTEDAQDTLDGMKSDFDNDDATAEDVAEATNAFETAQKALADWWGKNMPTLEDLRAINKEGENYSDWTHGETLIRDSYFLDYARELAEDIGAISGNESWPLNCIDWDRAVDEFKVDYGDIEIDGVTYWIRA